MYSSLFRELLTYMMEDPRNITASHAPAVHRQEHRAHRRPRHQHRRDDPLPGARARSCATARPEGRRVQLRGRQARAGHGGVPEPVKPPRPGRRGRGGAGRAAALQPGEGGLPRRGGRRRRGGAAPRSPRRKPDLVLLDWMLPLLSGLEVCRQMRRRPETRDLPVIMLTARGEESDRVRGARQPAPTTTSPSRSARASCSRASARCCAASRPATGEDAADLCRPGDGPGRAPRAARRPRRVHLGPTEFRLLRFLMQHPGRVFTREQLLDAVWGRDIYVEPRTVDVHIRRLRKALNARGRERPDPHRALRRLRAGRTRHNKS